MDLSLINFLSFIFIDLLVLRSDSFPWQYYPKTHCQTLYKKCLTLFYFHWSKIAALMPRVCIYFQIFGLLFSSLQIHCFDNWWLIIIGVQWLIFLDIFVQQTQYRYRHYRYKEGSTESLSIIVIPFSLLPSILDFFTIMIRIRVV